MEVHEKIRVLREINQWSQEDMAEKLSMSVAGYAKIERGKSSLNLEKLRKIADIFNIDITELIATQDKAFFFSIGDNTKYANNYSYIASDEKLLLENEKYRLLLEAKNELLTQKDEEILALKQVIELLKKQISEK